MKKKTTPRVPLPAIGPVDDPQSLYHQMRQYLEWQRVRNYSERTAENRENNLRLFITWCDERGVTQPQEVTGSELLGNIAANVVSGVGGALVGGDMPCWTSSRFGCGQGAATIPCRANGPPGPVTQDLLTRRPNVCNLHMCIMHICRGDT